MVKATLRRRRRSLPLAFVPNFARLNLGDKLQRLGQLEGGRRDIDDIEILVEHRLRQRWRAHPPRRRAG